MTTTTAVRIHVAGVVAAILVLVALAVAAPGAITKHACTPVTYDSSQDASPAYWVQWDAWRAAGYHAVKGDGVERLYPAGCAG